MKFKIGSHNTMSYLKPEKWYLRPFHFIVKCQSMSIADQYNYGIRLFDIRIRWDDGDYKWKFAHGSVTFVTSDVDFLFSLLNSCDDICYIRLILEYNKPAKNMSEIDRRFINICNVWRHRYDNLKFFEFRRKYDWEKLYSYEGEPHVDMYQAVSSMTSLFSKKMPWLDDWCPWLYAKLKNKENILRGTDHEYMLLDFIEIR